MADNIDDAGNAESVNPVAGEVKLEKLQEDLQTEKRQMIACIEEIFTTEKSFVESIQNVRNVLKSDEIPNIYSIPNYVRQELIVLTDDLTQSPVMKKAQKVNEENLTEVLTSLVDCYKSEEFKHYVKVMSKFLSQYDKIKSMTGPFLNTAAVADYLDDPQVRARLNINSIAAGEKKVLSNPYAKKNKTPGKALPARQFQKFGFDKDLAAGMQRVMRYGLLTDPLVGNVKKIKEISAKINESNSTKIIYSDAEKRFELIGQMASLTKQYAQEVNNKKEDANILVIIDENKATSALKTAQLLMLDHLVAAKKIINDEISKLSSSPNTKADYIQKTNLLNKISIQQTQLISGVIRSLESNIVHLKSQLRKAEDLNGAAEICEKLTIHYAKLQEIYEAKKQLPAIEGFKNDIKQNQKEIELCIKKSEGYTQAQQLFNKVAEVISDRQIAIPKLDDDIKKLEVKINKLELDIGKVEEELKYPKIKKDEVAQLNKSRKSLELQKTNLEREKKQLILDKKSAGVDINNANGRLVIAVSSKDLPQSAQVLINREIARTVNKASEKIKFNAKSNRSVRGVEQAINKARNYTMGLFGKPNKPIAKSQESENVTQPKKNGR